MSLGNVTSSDLLTSDPDTAEQHQIHRCIQLLKSTVINVWVLVVCLINRCAAFTLLAATLVENVYCLFGVLLCCGTSCFMAVNFFFLPIKTTTSLLLKWLNKNGYFVNRYFWGFMVQVWLIYKRMEFKKMYLQIKHNIFSIFFFLPLLYLGEGRN